jgi:hypothetical protein
MFYFFFAYKELKKKTRNCIFLPKGISEISAIMAKSWAYPTSFVASTNVNDTGSPIFSKFYDPNHRK